MSGKEQKKGGWNCHPECLGIKLKTIAMVMNKCGITYEEYMKDRKKYLQKCKVKLGGADNG